MGVSTASLPDLVDLTDDWLRFLQNHPELEQVPPSSVPGWPSLLGATVALAGVALTDVPRDLSRDFPLALQQVRDDLQADVVDRGKLDDDLRFLRLTAASLYVATGHDPLGLMTGAPGPNLGLSTSPAAVQRADAAAVADTVARILTWQKAHHNAVHGQLVVAEAERAGAEVSVGVATRALAQTVTDGLRAVRRVWIPELRDQLTEMVHLERDLRRSTDQDIRERFAEQLDLIRQRVGDLVRWLTTEALPDIREDLRAERQARRETDQELRQRVARLTQANAETDHDLLTQLAPLVAWAGAFGVHTTEKVKRLEDPLDQLLNVDWSMLLGFASFPALVTLIGKLLPHVAGEVPEVLGSLEGAAARALGAL